MNSDTELLAIPVECLSIIKSNLLNIDLAQFNQTCRFLNNIPLYDPHELQVRKCKWRGCGTPYNSTLILDEHAECWEYCIKRWPHIMNVYKDANTFIKICQYGHSKVIKFLLNYEFWDGSRVHKRFLTKCIDDHRDIITKNCCMSGDLEFLEYLYLTDVGRCKRVSCRFDLFTIACSYGFIDIAKYCFQEPCLLLHDCRRDEELLYSGLASALNIQSRPFMTDHLNVVKWIIEHSKPYATKSTFGNILHAACVTGSFDLVQYVVTTKFIGGYLSAKDLSFSTKNHTLEYICKLGYIDILQYLMMESKIKLTCKHLTYHNRPLLAACLYGHLDIVKLLLNFVDSRNCGFTTHELTSEVLRNACRSGSLDLVKYLLHIDLPQVSKRSTKSSTSKMTVNYKKFRINVSLDQIMPLLMDPEGILYPGHPESRSNGSR